MEDNEKKPDQEMGSVNPRMRFELIGQSYKIIIVGAGLGGLVAGIALSKKGHKVTILEAASKLGEVAVLQFASANFRSALAFKCLQTRQKC